MQDQQKRKAQAQPNNQQPNAQDKMAIKFSFPDISKFVKFELPKKIGLVDLVPTFSKILEIDLNSTILAYYLQQKDKPPLRLDENNPLKNQGMTGTDYEINVTFDHFGA